jgi:hypothetical protein
MKTETLSIDLLRIDGDTQSRVAIDQDVVSDYSEVIQDAEGWPFPPLDVFHDGTDYFIADGFHRKLGALRAKRASVPCNVHEGTARDARIFGMTANDRHGLRMTRADKRRCVEWLLNNGGKMTQASIAETAGVAKRTVATIIAERKAEVAKNLPPQTGEKDANCTFSSRSGGKKQAETATDSERDSTPPEPAPFVENPDADPPPELEQQPESEPQVSIVLDSLDRPVPQQFRDAHDMAGGIATQARRLDPILRELLSLSEDVGGEFLPRSALETEIKALKARILGSCYAFECPRCQGVIGKPCNACQGRGWWPLEKKGKLSAADKKYLGVD